MDNTMDSMIFSYSDFEIQIPELMVEEMANPINILDYIPKPENEDKFLVDLCKELVENGEILETITCSKCEKINTNAITNHPYKLTSYCDSFHCHYYSNRFLDKEEFDSKFDVLFDAIDIACNNQECFELLNDAILIRKFSEIPIQIMQE